MQNDESIMLKMPLLNYTIAVNYSFNKKTKSQFCIIFLQMKSMRTCSKRKILNAHANIWYKMIRMFSSSKSEQLVSRTVESTNMELIEKELDESERDCVYI